MKCISLLYHDVLEERGQYSRSGFTGAGPDRYKLTSDLFQKHLESAGPYFCEQYTKFDLPELREAKQAQDLYAITFDDGGKSFITTIAPLLEKNSLRGVFFISTGYINTPNFLSAQEIRELHDRGHIIGSHSHSHPKNISSLTEKGIREEWSESCRILSAITGEKITIASVPAGFYSEKVLRAAAEVGIEVLFTSEPTSTVVSRSGVKVMGRYFLQDNDPPAKVERIVRNSLYFRWKQYVFWNTKKLMKRILGNTYFLLRNKILAKTSD